MAADSDRVLQALRRVRGPDLESNIVDLGLVSEVMVKNRRAYFSITVPPERAEELEQLRIAAEKVAGDVEGIDAVTAVLTADSNAGTASRPQATPNKPTPRPAVGLVPEHSRVSEARRQGATGDGAGPRQAAQSSGQKQMPGIPGVKYVIAVASGKGGVGKSTAAVNLALGLQAIGHRVGIVDADIYGPSQPKLLGLKGRPQVAHGKVIKPLEGWGLKVMSMGFLVDEETPVVWRGPMVASALSQMLRETLWASGDEELDCLIIDMPPGTGDVQLTISQSVPLAGAVIVSTPQDLALIDARKGIGMFRRVEVPILGIVENMSYFSCPSCGTRSDIFGHGGAREEAEKLDVPFLGEIPLHMDIRSTSDCGKPVVVSSPDSEHALAFKAAAAAMWQQIEKAQGTLTPPPKIDVADDGSALKTAFPDGRTFDFSAEMLRVLSPSAEVQGHSPEQRVTIGGKKNVRITELKPVGNYATRIVFDDGHNTGLYSWGYLHRLGLEKDARWQSYLDELAAEGMTRD